MAALLQFAALADFSSTKKSNGKTRGLLMLNETQSSAGR
jgi:hypothetical protein